MTTLRDSFNALAPESLARSPTLPTSHREGISATQPCRSGPDGQSLSQGHSGGGHQRVPHACGNRHWPQCQQHITQPWLEPHLEQQRPGPSCLLTCTVPETLRPFLRSHQRLAYHALLHASTTARKRLAQDTPFIGTALPGCTGVLHTWGRQLQYHPPMHSLVPGGGPSEDRTTWRPATANFFVPVTALSPISRALFKEDMRPAGLLEHIDPQVWTIPWHVQRRANHHGHSACTSRAPSVCRVAISNPRLVSLTDRTVTFPSRQVGSARPRTTPFDVMACIRRFLSMSCPTAACKADTSAFSMPAVPSLSTPSAG